MKIPSAPSAAFKIFAFGGLCAAASAFAGGVPQSGMIYLGTGPQYGGSVPMQFEDGGEFTAVLFSNISGSGNSVTVTPTAVPSGYAAGALGTIPLSESSGWSSPGGDTGGPTDVGDNPFVGVPGFETFCVEDQVDFYIGNYYDYSLGLGIQQTGTAANGHAITSLTNGTAYLYQQFAIGNIVLSTPAQAGLFQAAVWYLQGQPNDPNVGNFSPTNPYYLDVLAHMSATYAQTGVTNDSYNVEVLELTGPAGSPNGQGGLSQDQLIYVGGSVPDATTTAVLFALGLAALAGARRRLA